MGLNSDLVQPSKRNNGDMLVAKHGALVIADTETHTGRWGAIVAETDAIINEMKVNGSVTAATLNNYCTANRSAKDVYIMAETDVITSIKLTSGRVQMINE